MLSNIAYGIGIVALAAVLGAAQHRTRAQEISQDTGLVCDTAEEMDSVLAAYDGGASFTDALKIVNAEKVTCAVVTVAFYRGKQLKEVTTRVGVLAETEILVIAAIFHGQTIPMEPQKQVTVFTVKGKDT
ncbi:MAG: hypothetical protein WBF03_20740 [Xanthobacteraceae bacterium]|jgi:hypothetical protein